jgi:mevalonate pyrophosphate decarboxylase
MYVVYVRGVSPRNGCARADSAASVAAAAAAACVRPPYVLQQRKRNIRIAIE